MLKVKKLHPEAKLPTCAHMNSDLGYDIYSCINEIVIAGTVSRISTGIAVEYPYNWGFLLKERSSMALKGISVIGGVIDAGYRGEIIVNLVNHTNKTYTILQGDKICQMLPLKPQTAHEPFEVDDLEETERGSKGFGSTGR